jgi:protein-disulfide isomerase
LLGKYPKDVKLVFKNFPLPNHPYANKASMAALAADRQGKFWEYHRKLFESNASLSDAKMKDIATELGLDIEKFTKDLRDPGLQSLISRDLTEGVKAEVQGTPTLFVNGKPVRNASLEGFQQMIEKEMSKGK